MAFLLRAAVAADAPLLERMLLAAATWRGDSDLTAASLPLNPHLWHYVAGWPRSDDFGFVAGIDDDAADRGPEVATPVGAAWARFFEPDDPGYGFVAAGIPEVSVGIDAAWRGRGAGRALLEALIAEARERGLPGLSLSVEEENTRARRLYRSLGFVDVGRVQNSPTMLLRFIT
jgi:ribosomal protein S18 acetylase RimI-like enzyme